jgi:spore maturation protein CgeB
MLIIDYLKKLNFGKTKKLKIMRICPAPNNIIEFRNNNNLDNIDWLSQVKIMQNENIFIPGSWAKEMSSLGCIVFDTLFDDVSLAFSWANENNYLKAYDQTNPLFEILLKQVEIFKPDIIIFWTGGLYKVDLSHRKYLRDISTNKIVFATVWGDEIPKDTSYNEYFKDIDIAFAVNNAYKAKFLENNINAVNFGSGFDENIFNQKVTPIKNRKYNIIMSGDTGYLRPDHYNRYNILTKLINEIDLKIFTTEPTEINLDTDNFFYNKKSLMELRPDKVNPSLLNGRDYYSLLNNSKIVLNIHRDECLDYGNLRCFEACGAGSLLLTDRSEELNEFYLIETNIENLNINKITAEVIGFTSIDDCIFKIKFLLSRPDLIERITQNAIKRTLKDHTVKKRALLMYEHFAKITF